MIIIVFASPLFVNAQQESKSIEDLRAQIKNTTNDTLKAKLYGSLAWELRFSKIAESIDFAEKEIAIGYQYKNNLLLAEGYRAKGLTLVIDEQIEQGMACYDSALIFAKRAGSIYYESSCYSLMAGMYADHSDFDKAIELYSKGLDVARPSNDPKLIAMLSNNLGGMLPIEQARYEAYAAILFTGFRELHKIENWPTAAMNSANLAQEYVNNGMKSEANTEIKRAIDFMNRNKNDVYAYGTTSHVLASVFL